MAPRNCFARSLVGVSLPIVVVCGLFVRCGSHCIDLLILITVVGHTASTIEGGGVAVPELLRTVLSGCVLAYCCGLWSVLGAGPIVLLININGGGGGRNNSVAPRGSFNTVGGGLYNRGRGCGTPELLRTVLSGCVLAYCCGLWSFCCGLWSFC